MRLVFWIALKSLASKRLALLLSILGIAVGVAAVWAIQIVDLNTVLGLRDHFRRESGNPDIEAHVADSRVLGARAALQIVESDRHVFAATPLATGRVAGRKGEGAPIDLATAAFDPATAKYFDPWHIVQGRDFRSGDTRVCLLGSKAAQDLKAGLGARITLQRPPISSTGCADGEVVATLPEQAAGPKIEFEVVGILADRYLARSNGGRMVALPWEDAFALEGGKSPETRFWIRLKPEVSIRQAMASIGDRFHLRVPSAREVGETAEERAFRSGVRIASFVALGVGLFIIYHLLMLAVTAWVRQAGLLGALGMTGSGIGVIFFVEALILAVLGTLLGVLLGIAIARGMLAFNLTTLGWKRPVSGFEIPWRDLWWVASAGIGASLLGALPPLLKIRRVPIVSALTQGEAALGALPPLKWLPPLVLACVPVLALFTSWAFRWVDPEVLRVAMMMAAVFGGFVLFLWALPGVLAKSVGAFLKLLDRGRALEPYLVRKGLDSRLRRFAGSVTGLSLVAAGLVTLHVMTGALKEEKDAWGARVLPGHLFLRIAPTPREQVMKLSEIEGVRSVLAADASVNQSFEIRGIPVDDALRAGLLEGASLVSEREEFALGRGMVVTSVCAREHDLKIGQVIEFPTHRGPRSFRVLDIDDRVAFFPHERAYALISEGAMNQVFCRKAAKFEQVTLKLEDGVSEHDVFTKLAALGIPGPAAPGVVWTGSHQRNRYRQEIESDFRIFDVILGLTAILAALGLMNTLVVSGLERQRELALLRAVGVTRRQVFRLFLAEASMLGLCGGVLGILMALPFSALVVSGLARLSGMPLHWRLDPGIIVFALVAIALLALLASILPARHAGRSDLLAALKSE